MSTEEQIKSLTMRVEYLESLIAPMPTPIAGEIMKAIASKHGMLISELIKPCRVGPVVAPRHIAMYVIRKTTNDTLTNIATMFKRQPVTVCNAVKSVENRMSVDAKFKSEVESWLTHFSDR